MRLRPLTGILLAIAAVSFLAWEERVGAPLVLIAEFFGIFIVPILLGWLIYSLYVIWRYPERRRSQAIAVACCVVAAALIPGLHGYYVFASRSAADHVVQTVQEYKNQHGHYPHQLEEAGVKKKRWGMQYYAASDQAAALWYPGRYPFSMNVYRFENGLWEYSED